VTTSRRRIERGLRRDPVPEVYGTRPVRAANLATNNGFGTQPNAFDTLNINNELASAARATWAQLYANAVAGKAIPPPYFTNAYDRRSSRAAITAYKNTVAGANRRRSDARRLEHGHGHRTRRHCRSVEGRLDGNGILVHIARCATTRRSISRC